MSIQALPLSGAVAEEELIKVTLDFKRKISLEHH